MLSVKKVQAGRSAVDYYLNQTRTGMAEYYLQDRTELADNRPALTAPPTAWWGGSARALDLAGTVERAQFEPLYATGHRPDGTKLGRRFRLPEEAAAAKADDMAATETIVDDYARWLAQHEIRRRGNQPSVSAWDCTFSPVKSVSLLWASGNPAVQDAVWAGHLAAVDAGLGYLEEHAAYVRAGKGGVRILDTDGLLVARMNEWTSRTGDMQLHTHCLILNRARTTEDGAWRALDGRALLSARAGAGALYNRTVEAELTRRLGVNWRDRPDGLREIDGVDDQLIEAFSSRRRAITTHLQTMIDAYTERHGHEPSQAAISAMAQTATLTTRPSKHDITPDDAIELWEATARRQGEALRGLPERVTGHATALREAPVDRQIGAVIGRIIEAGKPTFTRHELLRSCLDIVTPGDRTPVELLVAAEELADTVATSPRLITVTLDDPSEPASLDRRANGESVHDEPARQRWALRRTLDQERYLLDVSNEPTGLTTTTRQIAASAAANGLSVDQHDAVEQLLTNDRRVSLLVGPAGAGKTRSLRAAAHAWTADGGEVIGLTVSQAAAEVLADEARMSAHNIAKWLRDTATGNAHIPAGALVVIDEASMIGTATLVELVDQARTAGARVLLVGDPAQLSAIDIGGAFTLLADRHGATQLHEVRRFVNGWEAAASLKLRERDVSCLAAYAWHGRLHEGPVDTIETAALQAWLHDSQQIKPDGTRQSAMMIVTTNEQAAVLSERARHALQTAGIVSTGPTVRLRTNSASAGDHIVTRRNDRTLRTSDDSWVTNGSRWIVQTVGPRGDIRARHADSHATVTLPADYAAAHVDLAYATTAHRAQGATVDIGHLIIDDNLTHPSLYVGLTRGRVSNHIWSTTETQHGETPATIEERLSKTITAETTAPVSVHDAINPERTPRPAPDRPARLTT